MLLSCGTGAWRVRSSMNTLARELGITCTADIGLLSIEYTCIDGGNCYTESLCLFNTGVNTSKLIEWNCLLTNFPKTARRCLEMNFIHYLIRFMKFMDLLSAIPWSGCSCCMQCIYFFTRWRTD